MPTRDFTYSAAITPEVRAAEFPDDFMVLKDQLWCKWCDIPMNTLRKDNLRKHLESKMHLGNKLKRKPHHIKFPNEIKEKEETETSVSG